MCKKTKGNYVMMTGILFVFISVLFLILHIYPENMALEMILFLFGLLLIFLGTRIKRGDKGKR